MKKIFVLAIALVASLGIASAQDNVMKIDHKDGSYTQFDMEDVYDVTFALNPWNKVGEGSYTFSDPKMFWEGRVDNVLLRKHYDEEHRYQLKGVFGGYGDDVLYFTYDEETGEVHVPDQNMGYEASATTSLGEYTNYLFVCDASYLNWMFTEEPEEDYPYQSYYDADSDTFYFAVGYYLWIDAFTVANFGYTGYTSSNGDTYTYEHFDVDSEKDSPAKKIAKMKNATLPKMNNEAEVVSLKVKKN